MVKEQLEIKRELTGLENDLNHKLTFEDFNKEGNDVIHGKSEVGPNEFLKTLRDYTESAAKESNIGPGKRFATKADALAHIDMGREFANKFREKAIETGRLETPTYTLNMNIPVDMIPEVVKFWYDNAKLAGKTINSVFRDVNLWKDTGWWIGKDGKWRYELGNNDFMFRPNVVGFLKTAERGSPTSIFLRDVIDAPKLFEAFPELSRLKVKVDTSLNHAGMYQPSKNRIVISRWNKTDFYHELQHAVNWTADSKFKGTNIAYEKFKLVEGIIKDITDKNSLEVLLRNDFKGQLDVLMEADTWLQSEAAISKIAFESDYNMSRKVKNTLLDLNYESGKKYKFDPGEN